MQEWSVAMDCSLEEERYETDYDGINGFECFERKCYKGTVIVRCIGEHGHNYPLWDYEGAAAEIAWGFMKSHSRKNV